jgi:nucleoside-diphosphate-sugar epimerase
MSNIFITGSSGFVGLNLKRYLGSSSVILEFNREKELKFNSNVVIHLAGKAHDLKNASTPEEYYQVNTELTIKVFDAFLASETNVFITLSSVKAVADMVEDFLTEEDVPNPITHYGKSKFLAEQYILSKEIPQGKRVYILRPCMIHGPGNRGNLNLLYNFVSKRLPWPLGACENKRSFCSIENLCFIIKELIEREDIPSGVYNVADDEALSTNDLIRLISQSQNKDFRIWNISKTFINMLAKIGDKLHLPLNSERLQKLIENYVVNNAKIKNALGKELPVSAKDGLLKTFKSFSAHA